MEPTIREAMANEAEGLLEAYEWLFAAPGSQPAGWSPSRAREALVEAIGSERSTVLVAEQDGVLVGICTAYLDVNSVRYGSRCWVEDLAVDPERRSAGIGGLLLDEACGWARLRGATHLELDTGLARADAQRFYQRRGPDAVGYSYSWRL